MVILNPLSGELVDSESGDVIQNEKVLMFLSNRFSVEQANAHRFCLHSIRRMFEKYPNLMMINGWSKNFMAMALKQQPSIGLASRPKLKQGDRKLIIQHSVRVKSSELSIGTIDLVEEKTDVPNIHGLKRTSISVVYKDQPSLEIDEGTHFSLLIDGESNSLAFTRMDEIYWQPIHILKAEHFLRTEYATEDRQKIDHSKTVSIKIEQDYDNLTLDSVIHAILMDMNLDDEEDFEEEMNELKEALSVIKSMHPEDFKDEEKPE